MAKKNDVDLTENETIETNGDLVEGGETTEAAQPEAPVSKRKKMSKEVVYGDDACVKIQVVGGDQGEMTFLMSDLPEDIVTKLAPFGLGHKLGDAAAGCSGIEAEAAVQKVWEGLTKGEWTTRQPAAPKIDRKVVLERMNGMSPEDQEKAKALLASLGVSL